MSEKFLVVFSIGIIMIFACFGNGSLRDWEEAVASKFEVGFILRLIFPDVRKKRQQNRTGITSTQILIAEDGEIPTDEYDIKMDRIITEKEVIE